MILNTKIIKKSTFLNTDGKSFKLVPDEFKPNINNFSTGAVFGDKFRWLS